jgi:hypothetical protein
MAAPQSPQIRRKTEGFMPGNLPARAPRVKKFGSIEPRHAQQDFNRIDAKAGVVQAGASSPRRKSFSAPFEISAKALPKITIARPVSRSPIHGFPLLPLLQFARGFAKADQTSLTGPSCPILILR